jgi:hypothetical protein
VSTKRRRRSQRELAGNRYELVCSIAALKTENRADLGVSQRAGSSHILKILQGALWD